MPGPRKPPGPRRAPGPARAPGPPRAPEPPSEPRARRAPGPPLARSARDAAQNLKEQAIAAAQDALGRAFEPLTPDRRRAMTREHLLDAAAIVFARDGFHVASLDEIAAMAGFTKGAVYSNFKGKDDLFLALMDRHISRQFDDIVTALNTEERRQEEQLPRIAATVVEHMWDDAWSMLWLEFVLYAARNPDARVKVAALMKKSRGRIEELIEKEYAHTGEPPRYASEQIAIISTAMFDGIGMYHLIEPDLVNDETIETLLHLMYDSLGVSDAESGTIA